MNTEENIFKKTLIRFEKLKEYGFKKTKDGFEYKKSFKNKEFYAVVTISLSGEVKGKVIDTNTNEEYLPLRSENTKNAFANKIKAEYETILKDIKSKCTVEKLFIFDQSNRIADMIFEEYKAEPDFPWAKEKTYADAAVFRNKDSKKWFALLMNIDKSKIDKKETGLTEIMNLKLESSEIPELLKKDGFYPAYHMNKKNWITVVLNDTVSDKIIKELIEKSFSFTVLHNKK